MAGAGKKKKLQDALKAVAEKRGVPFSIQMRPLEVESAGDVAAAGATEEGAGPGEGEGGFQYESSLVHIGLDIARMSMKDKHILAPVLVKLGQGSQVMAGEQGRGYRILVLYHAHLLSSESILLLQACLEQNEGDLSIWLTSELPVPNRVRDWFVEIPVAGEDRTFETFRGALGKPSADWPDIFRAIVDKWRKGAPAKLQDLKEIKVFIYEMLMRNLRWVEVTHFLLDTILTHEELTVEERGKALEILASMEATAGGLTIPSYRIPILWESLFLQLRNTFHTAPIPTIPASSVSSQQSDGVVPKGKGAAATRTQRVGRPRKTSVEAAGTQVASV